MQSAASPPRYVTLRDYARVLRRYWYLIGVIGVIGAVAGYVAANRKQPMYAATAAVSFQDPAQDLPLVGLAPGLEQEPAVLAEQNAETLSRPQIADRVSARLQRLGAHAASSSVSSAVSAAGLLTITAQSSDASVAQLLANTTATVLVQQENQTIRGGFAAAARDLQRQIASLRRRGSSPAVATQRLTDEQNLARVQSLARFAQTAQVAQTAQQPGTALSRNAGRDAILGLVLGLLLAIVAAFLRDSSDRRVRTRGDVEDAFHLPILGHVRNAAMGKVLQLDRADADADRDVEAARILRRNLESLGSEAAPRLVLVTSALPEEGKTTVASALAISMASAGRRTLLVECDLRRPTLAKRLNLDPTPGMAEFLAGTASPEDVLRVVPFDANPLYNGNGNGHAEEAHALACIPAGVPTSRATELLASDRFRSFLEEVASVYDVVIVDSGPLLPVADTLEILPRVDGIIVCARELRTTREQASAAKAAIARFPERPTGVVITGVKPRRREYEIYEYSYTAG